MPISHYVGTVVVLFSPVFDVYEKLAGSEIEDAIRGETTGNLEDLLLAVGKTSQDNSTLIMTKRTELSLSFDLF